MNERLLSYKQAKEALNIKSDNKFNELIKKGLPFIQPSGSGGKLFFYFPDMLVWMKDQTEKERKDESI